MECKQRAPLRSLAEQQGGVVSRAQLAAAGYPRGSIDSLVRRGVLVRVFRGVYALGHLALTDRGRWMAAILSCGDGVALSHESAARLWGWRIADDGRVHVTTRRDLHHRRGLAVHVTRRLARADVIRIDGLWVTTRERTTIDLADVQPWEELRRALDHGVRLDHAALRAAHERAPGRRGAPSVRRLLGSDDDVRTRSKLERALRRLCRAHAYELPESNVAILGHERDFAWRTRRLVLEVDGHATHAVRQAREEDYRRDAELQRAGWRVIRASYDQVVREPAATAALLAAFLALGLDQA